jgi:hypothetical protein
MPKLRACWVVPSGTVDDWIAATTEVWAALQRQWDDWHCGVGHRAFIVQSLEELQSHSKTPGAPMILAFPQMGQLATSPVVLPLSMSGWTP